MATAPPPVAQKAELVLKSTLLSDMAAKVNSFISVTFFFCSSYLEIRLADFYEGACLTFFPILLIKSEVGNP